jgi:predicted RNA methylase
MTTAVISATLGPQEFPAGQAPIANYQFTITGGDLTSPLVLDAVPGTSPLSVTTPTLNPGSYTVSAVQIDASGNVIGSPVTDTFSVAAVSPVTLQVIQSPLTVTVNP